eukprot:1152307-Pelagomonas_calceolata.AAC.2
MEGGECAFRNMWNDIAGEVVTPGSTAGREKVGLNTLWSSWNAVSSSFPGAVVGEKSFTDKTC